MTKKCYFLLFFFCIVSPLSGTDIQQIPSFSENDRILILAPHPDDESIGAAGVIQKALQTGAAINVVCFTNGDHNQLSFIVYEKRITLREKEFIHMGVTRRKETFAAMKVLGLPIQDVKFLGYPDFGTLTIMTKYWHTKTPYKSFLTKISKVPYSECLSPGAPYVGESILKDIKTLINDFKPTRIFVTMGADTNTDHRALYLFLKIALWDLGDGILKPTVYPYIVHVAPFLINTTGWPSPKGYHPDLPLTIPEKLHDIKAYALPLTHDEVAVKYKALLCYKSQIEYSPQYIVSFARKNELFGDLPDIMINESSSNSAELQWHEVKESSKTVISESSKHHSKSLMISRLAYARLPHMFLVRINLKRMIDKDLGVRIMMLGYSRYIPFADMPKLEITIGLFGITVRDKRQTLKNHGITYSLKGAELIIKIPLRKLGYPQYLLTLTDTNDLPFEETAWRVILLQ